MCSGGITTRAPTGLSHRTTVPTARPAVYPAGRDQPGSASSTHRSARLTTLMNPHQHQCARLTPLRKISHYQPCTPQNIPLINRNKRAHHLRNQSARLHEYDDEIPVSIVS